jgi:hypothetical protein
MLTGLRNISPSLASTTLADFSRARDVGRRIGAAEKVSAMRRRLYIVLHRRTSSATPRICRGNRRRDASFVMSDKAARNCPKLLFLGFSHAMFMTQPVRDTPNSRAMSSTE